MNMVVVARCHNFSILAAALMMAKKEENVKVQEEFSVGSS
jgi:hypothetical protein